MGISDMIAGFILEMLQMEDGCAELQRQDLAHRFNCVPSQINYVISTRFSPEHGYIVESRRGGGGYIRISKVEPGAGCIIMHTVNAIGDSIDKNGVSAFLSNLAGAGAISPKDAKLIWSALSDRALSSVPKAEQDGLRANIFKQMLISLN